MTTDNTTPAPARMFTDATPEAEPTLADFQEGQWWIVELDAMARSPQASPDQKRAVAVVHRLLRTIHGTATPEAAAIEEYEPSDLGPDGTNCSICGKPLALPNNE